MKEQLIELVEAYAAARATGNATLQKMAVAAFNQFLAQVDVVPIEASAAAAAGDGAGA